MAVRNPARYLAPVALVAVIVAVILVTNGALDNHHATPAHRARQRVASNRPAPRNRFYVIRAGDSLSSISVKTGVTISELEALNPSIDPSALQAGQRLRLRP